MITSIAISFSLALVQRFTVRVVFACVFVCTLEGLAGIPVVVFLDAFSIPGHVSLLL
jgi:hypothetical protein